MLDIKYLVENLDYCKEVLAHRNGKFDVDKAVELSTEEQMKPIYEKLNAKIFI